jgi:CheY-like chemotaxis protein
MGLSQSKRPVVLIVEDELLLRMNAVEMIEAAGFEGVEAANADEAIDILEKAAATSPWCSPISRCRVPWMG